MTWYWLRLREATLVSYETPVNCGLQVRESYVYTHTRVYTSLLSRHLIGDSVGANLPSVVRHSIQLALTDSQPVRATLTDADEIGGRHYQKLWRRQVITIGDY